MTCMRKLHPQRDLVGKMALLEGKASPFGSVEASEATLSAHGEGRRPGRGDFHTRRTALRKSFCQKT